MKGVLLLVCVLSVVLCLSAADTSVIYEQWPKDKFPNPQVDLMDCGRKGGKSWVCDPNNLLPFSKAEKLDQLIQKVRNNTQCPCQESECLQEERKNRGYKVALAVMQGMASQAEEGQGNQDHMLNELDDNLHKAFVFTHYLSNKWDIGRCKEYVIILFSLEDNVLYTFTGARARETLTDNLVGEISAKNRLFFGMGSDHIFVALEKLILDYEAVFRGEYVAHYNAGTPQAAPVRSKAPQNTAASHIVEFVFLLAMIYKLLF